MRAKISSLYNQSKTESKPLLGTNTFDFWQSYINGASVYDRYFKDHFSGFYYFNNFSDTATASEIFDDFTDAVQAFITLNSKRYSELFRVHVLPTSAYDVVNNYDLNETHTRTASGNGSNVSGAREDTQTGSSVEGARTDSGTTNMGAQNTTTTRSIEGFNSSGFSDSNQDVTAATAHTDTTSVSKGEQRDSNSSTLNKGEQTDTHTSSETENITIRRYGNIGVQTPADVIGGHIELWDMFNFYKQVFDEIAKEYLLLDNCFENPSSE